MMRKSLLLLKKTNIHVTHELCPVYNEFSQILILGSLPSVKSRELKFYYMHPQNRFWKVLECVFHTPITDKKAFCLSHGIALWDVIESCDIHGSRDSSISHVKVNDISSLLSKTHINRIFTTGKMASDLYEKYCYSSTHIHAKPLPSTSPLNAQYHLEDLVKAYEVIK